MHLAFRSSIQWSFLCLASLSMFQSQPALGQPGGGPKQGTVSSISGGAGIQLSPDPITTTGSVAIATNGVTNSMLFGGIAPSKITGTAAILGANTFTATQTLSSGNLALPATFGSTSGVLTIGGASFLHAFGLNNTYVGAEAGNFTQTAVENTAIGKHALRNTTSGSTNTAVGYQSMMGNTEGFANTAVGFNSMLHNEDGVGNTAVGFSALNANIAGVGNTAVGINALQFVEGRNNIGIGAGAGFDLTGSFDHNIYIGNEGAPENGTMRFGTSGFQTLTFIAGITGVTPGGAAVPVVIDGDGQLGTAPSSRRYKYDIRPMDRATSNLLRLRPVTFRYKQAQNDGSHPLQYGLIAEEVAEVYPEMVQTTADGEPNAVLYQFLPAMLLNELQNQQQQIEAQRAQIEALRAQLEQLAAATHRVQSQLAAFQSREADSPGLLAVASRP